MSYTNRMYGIKVDPPKYPGQPPNTIDLAPLLAKMDQLIEALRAVTYIGTDQDKGNNNEQMIELVTFFSPVHARGNSVQGPLTVVLDTEGRSVVDVWVKSSGPSTFIIYGSVDGNDYRQATSIVLPEPGEAHIGYSNAYRYIKVETEAPNVNNNEIEIVASR